MDRGGAGANVRAQRDGTRAGAGSQGSSPPKGALAKGGPGIVLVRGRLLASRSYATAQLSTCRNPRATIAAGISAAMVRIRSPSRSPVNELFVPRQVR